ncbi:MAG: hypothetical protein H0V66_01120 [Bdellovibrionales bacterium]|nr:hypothetical protein [Bdellovibrionales bacterium]
MKLRISIFIILVVGLLCASFTPWEIKMTQNPVLSATKTKLLKAREIASEKKSSLVESQEYAKFLKQILEIQIQAEKDYEVYSSDTDVENNFHQAKFKFNFGYFPPELTFMNQVFDDPDNLQDALELSRGLATYRLTEDEDEKFQFLKYFYNLAASSYGYSKTDEFLDCGNGKIIYNDFEKATFEIGLNTTLEDGNYSSYTHTISEAGQDSIKEFLNELDHSSRSHKKSLNGVLVAWSTELQEMQVCDFNYPNPGFLATLSELKDLENAQIHASKPNMRIMSPDELNRYYDKLKNPWKE